MREFNTSQNKQNTMKDLDRLVEWFKKRVSVHKYEQHHLKFIMTEYAKIYHNEQLALYGVVASKPKSKDALNKAVSAIYFNDNSDYLKALYGIVNDLTDFNEPIDIRSLYKSLNPD